MGKHQLKGYKVTDQDTEITATSTPNTVSTLPVKTAGEIDGEVTDLRRKINASPNVVDKKSGVVFTALEGLNNAIAELDHELANFYDDIKPVLTPETSGENGGIATEKFGSESEISSMIRDKTALIDRITAHLQDTRKRIEL